MREYLIVISIQVYHYDNVISTLCFIMYYGTNLLMLNNNYQDIQEVVKDFT